MMGIKHHIPSTPSECLLLGYMKRPQPLGVDGPDCSVQAFFKTRVGHPEDQILGCRFFKIPTLTLTIQNTHDTRFHTQSAQSL